MRYPWITVLLLLGLVVAGVIAYVLYMRRTQKRVAWLSNTEVLRTLPAYREQMRWTRLGAAVFVVVVSVVALATSILAGAPVDRHVEHPTLANRDMVLCLDASGSMLPYDGQILRQFDQLVDRFDGERLSLQMWSGQSVIKFPLTDDYELMSDVLHEAADIIDRGYLGPHGEYVLVTPQLSHYLEGVEAPGDQIISSLSGDGLASCVLGFDHLDVERSRTILLATDNEVKGEQIYSLIQAVDFATKQGIELIALYPSDGGPLTAEGEQLRNAVESVGGTFYSASDPTAIEGIIQKVQSQDLAESDSAPTTVETDEPLGALVWAGWMFLAFLAVAAVRRL